MRVSLVTVTKQISTRFSSLAEAFAELRARFGTPEQGETAQVAQLASDDDLDMDKIDQSRYARLLDHELDRQLLTKVEREDTDTLNRVRAALYAD